MSLLLHIYTCFDYAMVALSEGETCLEMELNATYKECQSFIHEAARRMIKKQALSIGQIDALSVCAGPGSYTGIRIGLSAAKGICWGLQKPLISFSSLRAIAFAAGKIAPEYPLYSALHARQEEAYISAYASPFAEENIRAITQKEIAEHSETYSIAILEQEKELFASLSSQMTIYTVQPEIADFIAVALYYFNKKAYADLTRETPLYIKNNYL